VTVPAFGLEDLAFMDRALVCSVTMLGRTAPNPSVGAVLVRDGLIIGEGATQPGGRPHAEAMAVLAAGGSAPGATAYVTLEPCAHDSPRGAHCSGVLVRAGIARCVIAVGDPDPRTAGAGIARLQAAGIQVETGCREQEARHLLAGFFKRLATGWPLVTVSDDGNSHDAPFVLGYRETFESALDRMGREGLTRVWVQTGTPLALALAGRGLVDHQSGGVGQRNE
jgi:pyrimidine deaminase RibD-like protein